MNLSSHFTLEELIISESAARHGIDNEPSDAIIANLRGLAQGLEAVRALFSKPLHINSGYRCPALNALVGGASDSAHLEGYAADFIIPGFGMPFRVAEAIEVRLGIGYDKLIYEYGHWVHLSFDPRLRRIVETKRTRAEPYLVGLVPCMHDE